MLSSPKTKSYLFISVISHIYRNITVNTNNEKEPKEKQKTLNCYEIAKEKYDLRRTIYYSSETIFTIISIVIKICQIERLLKN
jgi:hypothetical protein